MIIALPIADRARSFAFYAEGLDLDAFGPVAEDGIPEPLRFDVQGTHVMLVPTGGFGWITGGRETAAPDVSECLLGLGVDTDREVDDLVARAAEAGAKVVAKPERRPWGYTGVFADPDGHLWQVRAATPPAPEQQPRPTG